MFGYSKEFSIASLDYLGKKCFMCKINDTSSRHQINEILRLLEIC